MPHPLAVVIRDRRNTQNIAMNAAAKAAGVSFTTWWRVEHGQPPTLDTLSRMAVALGTTPGALLDELEVP